MTRAQLNFAVDAVIAVAFLVCAVTGMLFLLPPGALRALGLGMPGMLGISFRTWHWLHDWSGVVATVGVLVHAALHYRWIVTMTRRTFGSNKAPARRGARAPSRAPAEPGRAAPRPTAPAGYSTYRVDTARRNDQSRITRRRFLAGAAAGLGVAFLRRRPAASSRRRRGRRPAGDQRYEDIGGRHGVVLRLGRQHGLEWQHGLERRRRLGERDAERLERGRPGERRYLFVHRLRALPQRVPSGRVRLGRERQSRRREQRFALHPLSPLPGDLPGERHHGERLNRPRPLRSRGSTS